MANVKISALTAATAWTDDDLAVIVDDPSGSADTKRITLETLLTPAWGQISVAGGAGSQTLTASTWTKITQFVANDGVARNATEDHTTDKITVDNAGDYLARLQVTWTNDTSVVTEWAIYWNGVITSITHDGRTGTGDEVAFDGLHRVATGATDFEVWARVSVGADVDVVQARLYVQQIGN